jgi:fructokinase
MDKPIYGGIETGGTKFVCAIGNADGTLIEKIRIPTEDPEKTIELVADFFKPFYVNAGLRRIGIGSFGPIDAEINSVTYGYITSTPKPGWQNTNIVGLLRSRLDVDIVFDTDVNAAALGESLWGASRNLDPSLYITIGTGIGGGYIIEGRPLRGMANPEMGHIRIPHDWSKDPFKGACSYHGDCFEGLASGRSLIERLGKPAETISQDHPVWELEINYIGQAISNLVLILSPRIIILGGGLMKTDFLFKGIRRRVKEILNQYIQTDEIIENIEQYIVPPFLGDNAGVLGSIALAIPG